MEPPPRTRPRRTPIRAGEQRQLERKARQLEYSSSSEDGNDEEIYEFTEDKIRKALRVVLEDTEDVDESGTSYKLQPVVEQDALTVRDTKAVPVDYDAVRARVPRPRFSEVPDYSADPPAPPTEGAVFEYAKLQYVQPPEYIVYIDKSDEQLDKQIEYDLESEDEHFLEQLNAQRKTEGLAAVSEDVFESIIDRLEKESFRMDPVHEQPPEADIDVENTNCCVCNDGTSDDTNQILFCDGCDVAIHQDCYGVRTIPEGLWFCQKCQEQAPDEETVCQLCPRRGGAMKRVTSGGWAHVACAMWIPECGFTVREGGMKGDITALEKVPKERYRLTCDVCYKKVGACIQCKERHCRVAFHVTCAQASNYGMELKEKEDYIACQAYCWKHTPKRFQDQPPNTVYSLIEAKAPRRRRKGAAGATAPAAAAASTNGSSDAPQDEDKDDDEEEEEGQQADGNASSSDRDDDEEEEKSRDAPSDADDPDHSPEGRRSSKKKGAAAAASRGGKTPRRQPAPAAPAVASSSSSSGAAAAATPAAAATSASIATPSAASAAAAAPSASVMPPVPPPPVPATLAPLLPGLSSGPSPLPAAAAVAAALARTTRQPVVSNGKMKFRDVFSHYTLTLAEAESVIKQAPPKSLSAIWQFWISKRTARSGNPLIKRLRKAILFSARESANKQKAAAAAVEKKKRRKKKYTVAELEEAREKFAMMKLLRKDLERARILMELVKKREVAKLQYLKAVHEAWEWEHVPAYRSLLSFLEYFQREDRRGWLQEVVDTTVFTDYLEVVQQPMSWRIIRQRLDDGSLTDPDEFWDLMRLVCKNALNYNHYSAPVYKEANRLLKLIDATVAKLKMSAEEWASVQLAEQQEESLKLATKMTSKRKKIRLPGEEGAASGDQPKKPKPERPPRPTDGDDSRFPRRARSAESLAEERLRQQQQREKHVQQQFRAEGLRLKQLMKEWTRLRNPQQPPQAKSGGGGGRRGRAPGGAAVLEEALRDVLATLRKVDEDCFFEEPLDDVTVPHYTRIISHPMWLKKIEAKLQAHQYPNARSFQSDFELLCDNACTFNDPDTAYFRTAKHMRWLGDKLLKRIESGEFFKAGNEPPAVDAACCKCSGEKSGRLVVCSGCGRPAHIQCLQPPLHRVPKDHWFCDSCNPSRSCMGCAQELVADEEEDAALLVHCRGCNAAFHKKCIFPSGHPPRGFNVAEFLCPSCDVMLHCHVCQRDTGDESMLLCDMCDRGYHMYCLDPPVVCMPTRRWICSPCRIRKEVMGEPVEDEVEIEMYTPLPVPLPPSVSASASSKNKGRSRESSDSTPGLRRGRPAKYDENGNEVALDEDEVEEAAREYARRTHSKYRPGVTCKEEADAYERAVRLQEEEEEDAGEEQEEEHEEEQDEEDEEQEDDQRPEENDKQPVEAGDDEEEEENGAADEAVDGRVPNGVAEGKNGRKKTKQKKQTAKNNQEAGPQKPQQKDKQPPPPHAPPAQKKRTREEVALNGNAKITNFFRPEPKQRKAAAEAALLLKEPDDSDDVSSISTSGSTPLSSPRPPTRTAASRASSRGQLQRPASARGSSSSSSAAVKASRSIDDDVPSDGGSLGNSSNSNNSSTSKRRKTSADAPPAAPSATPGSSSGKPPAVTASASSSSSSGSAGGPSGSGGLVVNGGSLGLQPHTRRKAATAAAAALAAPSPPASPVLSPSAAPRGSAARNARRRLQQDESDETLPSAAKATRPSAAAAAAAPVAARSEPRVDRKRKQQEPEAAASPPAGASANKRAVRSTTPSDEAPPPTTTTPSAASAGARSVAPPRSLRQQSQLPQQPPPQPSSPSPAASSASGGGSERTRRAVSAASEPAAAASAAASPPPRKRPQPQQQPQPESGDTPRKRNAKLVANGKHAAEPVSAEAVDSSRPVSELLNDASLNVRTRGARLALGKLVGDGHDHDRKDAGHSTFRFDEPEAASKRTRKTETAGRHEAAASPTMTTERKFSSWHSRRKHF